MAYQLKLFLTVSLIALAAFYVSRPAFKDLMPAKVLSACWKIIGISIAISFLSRYTLVYFLGVAALTFVAYRMLGRDMKARVATFLLLTLIFPPVYQSLDGVADINHLFILDHVHTVSMLLLMPAALQLFMRKRTEGGNPYRTVDLFLVAYKLLELVLMFRSVSGTAVVRFLFEASTTVFFPYYVVTRGLRSVEDLKFAARTMMVAFFFLACVGAVEEMTAHLLYTPLADIYGTPWQLTRALMRAGILRVQATTPEPIVLAVLMMTALSLWAWLAGAGWRRPRNLLITGGLLVTLAFTWSRGPWIGAFLFAVSFVGLRYCSPRVYIAGLSALGVVVVASKISGADQMFYDVLKSVFGSSEDDFGTIEYRRRILDASIALMQQSPLFGVPNYAAYLQDFRQGEGIIDLVNSYLIIGLNTGVTGLALYLAPFLIVFFKLVNRLRPGDRKTPDLFVRAFASAILALLITLITTSTTGVMPYVLLSWIALPLVYIRYCNAPVEAAPVVAEPVMPVLRNVGWRA